MSRGSWPLAAGRWRPHSAGARSRPASRRVRARGQALVEFTLVLPILLLIVLAAVDFGRLFYTYVGVNNGAREAATFAAIQPGCLTSADCPDPGNQQFHARQELGGDTQVVVSATACVDQSGATAACQPGDFIRVTVSRPFAFLAPFLQWLGGSFRLGASAEAAIQ